jgi:hypothetical protein
MDAVPVPAGPPGAGVSLHDAVMLGTDGVIRFPVGIMARPSGPAVAPHLVGGDFQGGLPTTSMRFVAEAFQQANGGDAAGINGHGDLPSLSNFSGNV